MDNILGIEDAPPELRDHHEKYLAIYRNAVKELGSEDLVLIADFIGSNEILTFPREVLANDETFVPEMRKMIQTRPLKSLGVPSCGFWLIAMMPPAKLFTAFLQVHLLSPGGNA